MLSIVVAHDKNRTIGKNNHLPWHLPNDLKHVKKTTLGKTLIMGRKTFESIGRPLPGRTNVVLTSDLNWSFEGVTVIHSIEDIFQLERTSKNECIIFGGQTLFELLMPYVKKLYITFIDEVFEGDTFFPEIDYTEWKLVSKIKGEKDEKNKYDYYFLLYEKNND